MKRRLRKTERKIERIKKKDKILLKKFARKLSVHKNVVKYDEAIVNLEYLKKKLAITNSPDSEKEVIARQLDRDINRLKKKRE